MEPLLILIQRSVEYNCKQEKKDVMTHLTPDSSGPPLGIFHAVYMVGCKGTPHDRQLGVANVI